MTETISAARSLPIERAGDDRGVFTRSAPVEPYWAELARQEFCRRWHEENGDAIDTATEVYGK